VPDEHAVLSPSAAERWISCPASVRVAAAYPQTSSEYADEGTHAHTLGELRARAEILGEPVTDAELHDWEWEALGRGWDVNEMHRHIDGYLELLRERLAEHPHARLLLEQRVYTGIEGCWGTADAVIVAPDAIEVIDLKYGAGVSVSAYQNPQLMLYGVGALESYGDLIGDTELVKVTIYQPRRDSISTYEIGADALREWRDGIIPIAERALGDEAEFGPSAKACRWCPAAGACAARLAHVIDDDFGDDDPEFLDADALGALLDRLPEIKDFCAAVEKEALDRLYSRGEPVTGWKVVRSRGTRRIKNDALAAERLEAAGVDPDDVWAARKLLGVTSLDKLVGGKDRLEEILGDALGKSEGSESLAREDDPRPSISPATEAAADFDDLD
jgi:hypothetical protein